MAASKTTMVVGTPGRASVVPILGSSRTAFRDCCKTMLDLRCIEPQARKGASKNHSRAEGAKDSRPGRQAGRRYSAKMSAEGAELKRIKLELALYRTFGAHLTATCYPGLTAGPTFYRSFGPENPCSQNRPWLCNGFGSSPAKGSGLAGTPCKNAMLGAV